MEKVNKVGGKQTDKWREHTLIEAQLTNYCWFQVDKNSSRYMLACTCLTEKSVERIISSANGFVRRHLSVWLDTMLETVQFPTSVANLHTSLSNMYRNTLTLWVEGNTVIKFVIIKNLGFLPFLWIAVQQFTSRNWDQYSARELSNGRFSVVRVSTGSKMTVLYSTFNPWQRVTPQIQTDQSLF